MRVVSRPIAIDAVFWRGNLDDLEKLPLLEGWRDTDEFTVEDDGTLLIQTLEGPARALVDGHWVAHGTAGEHYPIRADIFERKYSGSRPARWVAAVWRLLGGAS